MTKDHRIELIARLRYKDTPGGRYWSATLAEVMSDAADALEAGLTEESGK